MTPFPDWMIQAAKQVAALTGTTSGFIPLVILVPIDQPKEPDVVTDEHGNLTILPPTAGMFAQSVIPGV